MRAGGHDEQSQQTGGAPSGSSHLHGHDEGTAEAGTQTGADEGLAHRQGDTVDQRLADAQQTCGQCAGDNVLQAGVAALLSLEVDSDSSANLTCTGHSQSGVQGNVAKALQLHGYRATRPWCMPIATMGRNRAVEI